MTIATTVTVPWEYRGETYQIECRVWPGRPPMPYPAQPYHLKNVPEVEPFTLNEWLSDGSRVRLEQCTALDEAAADTTSAFYIAAVGAAQNAAGEEHEDDRYER